MPDEKTLGLSVLSTIRDWVKSLTSKRTEAIPYGECDSTSTSNIFTATVPGITELKDGTTVMLKNGVVTSASGFTININNLGAKPVYNNMAAASAETTIFNVAYTMLFVYDSTRVAGGCWICYRGYDSNTNTIGYQLRTNSTVLKTYDKCRYYRLFFTAADGTHWVPANNGTDNSATSAKTVNQRPIDPFGRIVYCSANTNYAAEADVAATTIWDQYAFTLGYSFNRTGAALELTTKRPVYVKCAPQSNGSAIMDSTTPIVQALPSTEDGKIYIFLGIAYSATAVELVPEHPVYYYKDSAIRLWTNPAATGGSSVDPATATPLMDGTAAIGSSAKYAREDHVHPADTNKQATLVSGTNIKTVNNQSLLGSGNITISGGGSSGWTDISNEFTFNDLGEVIAITNGSLVMINGSGNNGSGQIITDNSSYLPADPAGIGGQYCGFGINEDSFIMLDSYVINNEFTINVYDAIVFSFSYPIDPS